MDLQNLSAQLNQKKYDLMASPPFDKWNPRFCGDMDMEIKADGRWFYMGSPIGRLTMVKLFASVLITETTEQGLTEYFLKTPAEKVRIQVEDAPFVITEWHEQDSQIMLTTNLGHQLVLGETNPLINLTKENGEPKLYVEVIRGLKARIHRNVFYQWVTAENSLVFEQNNKLYIRSGKNNFLLG